MPHWKTNVRTLWLSQFIAMIGMSGVIPFLPLYVRDLGVAPVESTASSVRASSGILLGMRPISVERSPAWA